MKKILCLMVAAFLLLGSVGALAEPEVLEFYHGYFHDASTWAPAAVMREIYDEFAAQHADGPVTFKPIAIENHTDMVTSMIAGGQFPDMVDMAGTALPLAALSQGLVYDMKPYLDQEGLQTAVGLNYTQNDVNGAIYTVHDQLLTMGFWYNEKIMNDAGAALPETWQTWDDFGKAMAAVRTYGDDKGIYGYGAGTDGSNRCFNARLALTPEGVEMLGRELTAEDVRSEAFANAFRETAALDQENGSAYAGVNANDFSTDFNNQLSAVFFNGVWAAGGFQDESNFQPAIFPGSVALSSAGAGHTIASGMSEEKTQLALEFVKYMTSEEVQKRIFLEVGANPCNANLDVAALAEETGDAGAILLAKACAQANGAQIIVPTSDSVWGNDVYLAIGNKLYECSAAGTDIEAKLAELQDELTALLA